MSSTNYQLMEMIPQFLKLYLLINWKDVSKWVYCNHVNIAVPNTANVFHLSKCRSIALVNVCCSWYISYSLQLVLWASHALPAPAPLTRHFRFIKIWTLLSIRLGAHKPNRVSCSPCHAVNDCLLTRQINFLWCLIIIRTVFYLLFHSCAVFWFCTLCLVTQIWFICMRHTVSFFLIFFICDDYVLHLLQYDNKLDLNLNLNLIHIAWCWYNIFGWIYTACNPRNYKELCAIPSVRDRFIYFFHLYIYGFSQWQSYKKHLYQH